MLSKQLKKPIIVSHKKIRTLPMISQTELEYLLKRTRKDFAELDPWIVYSEFRIIPTYAMVNVLRFRHNSPYSYPGKAIITVHPIACSYTRRAVQSFIAHELAHLLLISRGISHTETDIGKIVIAKGYGDGIEDVFFKECKTPCYGVIRRVLGGVDCKLFCPFVKRNIERR